MKLKIKFPYVVSFYDYHDITKHCDTLNELFVDKINCYECAFDGNYWGIFYTGRRPDRKTIKKLLAETGFEHDESSSWYTWDN